MVKIVIGSVECLFPERVPAEAFERLEKTLDDAPNGVDFHCSQCGALRTATFDPGLLVKYPMTCRNAPGQPACDRVPSPGGERKPATYRPGSLVFVKGLPEARDANWPAIIEDDPYNRHQFMIVSRKADGRETPLAYWVTLVPVGKEPRDYRGGFIRAENLVPFLPMQPPPDCSELYKSALGQATVAFHFNLANRLRMLSFVVRASFLAENPLPEPTFYDHNPELGTPVVESTQAGPSGVGSSQAGPSGGATSSEDRQRSARIAALRARLAAKPSEDTSPGSTAARGRGSGGASSRAGSLRGRGAGIGSSQAVAPGAGSSGAGPSGTAFTDPGPSGTGFAGVQHSGHPRAQHQGPSGSGAPGGASSRGGYPRGRSSSYQAAEQEDPFWQYWEDLQIAAQYMYPSADDIEDPNILADRLREIYIEDEPHEPMDFESFIWSPWFRSYLEEALREFGVRLYAYPAPHPDHPDVLMGTADFSGFNQQLDPAAGPSGTASQSGAFVEPFLFTFHEETAARSEPPRQPFPTQAPAGTAAQGGAPQQPDPMRVSAAAATQASAPRRPDPIEGPASFGEPLPGESQHDYQMRTLMDIGTRWLQRQQSPSEAGSSSGPPQRQDVDPTPAGTQREFLLRMARESGFKVLSDPTHGRSSSESGPSAAGTSGERRPRTEDTDEEQRKRRRQ